jgi:hypothetical protein
LVLATSAFAIAVQGNFLSQGINPHILFKSGFASAVALSAPNAGGLNGWQELTGKQSNSSFSWPISAWGGTANCTNCGIQDFAPSFSNSIAIQTDHYGHQSPVLSMSMNEVGGSSGTNPGDGSASQVDDLWLPSNTLAQQTDIYMSEWVYLQPDVGTQLIPGGPLPNGLYGNWRSLYGWKTGGTGNNYGGDFRIEGSVRIENNSQLCWGIEWDTDANGSVPFQSFYLPPDNCSVPVPVGQWFRLETFTHRAADTTGEFWAKVNGVTITDHFGANLGSGISYCNGPCPINRFFLTLDYTNGNVPAWQYVDDIVLMDKAP